jgi:hypothetical protein
MKRLTYGVLAVTALALLVAMPLSLARDKHEGPPLIERVTQMPGPVVPGVMVEVREVIERRESPTHVVQTAIEATLLKQGITVLDSGKPQFVVYGSSDTRYTDEKDAFGQPIHFCQTVVTLKITQVEGGKVLETVSETAREAGTEPMRAAVASLDKAAELAAQKVLQTLKGKAK